MSEIYAEAESRRTQALPAVPGINAGRIGPHVGTGRAGERGSWRTSAKQKLVASVKHRPSVFGGSPDPGKTTVSDPVEAAAIRARERGENPLLMSRLDGKLKSNDRMSETKKLARLEALGAETGGAALTPEMRALVASVHRSRGSIPPWWSVPQS